ncbi:hypothetical protein A2U01_0053740, partial [Trifolium medium]|nr:hypothetical protein [Trifolium medium]
MLGSATRRLKKWNLHQSTSGSVHQQLDLLYQ